MIRGLVIVAIAAIVATVPAQSDESESSYSQYDYETEKPCVYSSRLYVHGQTWNPHPCAVCTCNNLISECEIDTCPICKGVSKKPSRKQCCGKCDKKKVAPTEADFCSWRGKIYEDLEKFDLNVCTECECRKGTSYCTVQSCLDADCEDPITLPDKCCPVCPGDETAAQIL